MWSFLPKGITILPPKGSHQPILLPIGSLHFYSQSSAKSPLSSSSAVTPWWLPSLLSLESPERETTMEGFPKATLPTEVITVLPGITPVASTFNLSTEVVTVSMHRFSPPYLVRRCGRDSQLFHSPVVGTTQFSAMTGLAAWGSSDLLGHQCQSQPLVPLPHLWAELLQMQPD